MSGRDLLVEFQRSTGTTQTQLAGRFGVTSAYVSMLLSGARVVTRLDIAERIERATAGAVPAASWLPTTERRPPAKRKPAKRAVRRYRRETARQLPENT